MQFQGVCFTAACEVLASNQAAHPSTDMPLRYMIVGYQKHPHFNAACLSCWQWLQRRARRHNKHQAASVSCWQRPPGVVEGAEEGDVLVPDLDRLVHKQVGEAVRKLPGRYGGEAARAERR